MVKWLILLSFFLLFFGYMGFISIILIIVFYFILFSLKKEKKTEIKENSNEKNIILLDEIIKNEAIKKFNLNNIDTYKEILYSGSQDEKIELIGMVVFNPSKEYVDLIRHLLKDEDETIRILASNSLQKMENYFENIIDNINKELIYEVNKDKIKELYLKLIDTYDRFIESSLLESFQVLEYKAKIFQVFNQMHEEYLNEKNFKKSFYYMSVKYNKFDSIIEDLKERIENENSINDKFLLVEIYYKQNKIDLIKEILKNIKRKDIEDIDLKNSYDYWSNYVF
ncbi:MAG: hypothetical protein CL623_11125 [Arcobacter sp.]|nr:hypothetical protein [Arcobacter sp.]|tara:strand:- start:6609 stop:7454 length:846 start_codon:yes stop_codon:yes gene_type:complete